MLRLTVSYGGDLRRLTLMEGRSATLGASPDNDLVAPFPGVSRHHARVEPEEGEAVLVDLGSKNGLVVGGERRDRVVLEPGDRVVVGRAVVSLEEVRPSDLEIAVALDPGGTQVAGATRRGARSGETAPHWALHLVRDLESLAAGATEVRRTAVLAGIADAVGATGLWTFAVVEGDLFLRDCVGAVPSDQAISCVAETVLQDATALPRHPVEIQDRVGWMLICPPLAGAAPVLVTLHPADSRPEPWAADLLVHLAERLRLLEEEISTEDLPSLVRLFLRQATVRYGKRIQGVGRRALALLESRQWDGRLRELEHAIEGAVLRCPEGAVVEAAHFTGLEGGAPTGERESRAGAGTSPDETLVTDPFIPLRARLKETERIAIQEALERASGDHRKAARLLGVTPESLERRIARLRLG